MAAQESTYPSTADHPAQPGSADQRVGYPPQVSKVQQGYAAASDYGYDQSSPKSDLPGQLDTESTGRNYTHYQQYPPQYLAGPPAYDAAPDNTTFTTVSSLATRLIKLTL